jgi:hypothetical protein
LFGTYEKHNLRQAAFGRETNFWTIYEDFREPILGVTVSKDGTFLDQRSNTFLLYPTYQGTVIPYTYYADINHLQMNTAHGSVEFCMDDTDQLRIRGNGVGLKMILRAEKPFGSCCGCRGVYPTPEGAWEADMGIHGKMLFVPLKGALVLTDPWNVKKNEYDKLEIEFVPTAETDTFETAIHEYMDYRGREKSYPPFDDVKKATQKAFDDFVKKNLAPPAKGWEDFYKYCAYTVWSHRTGVCGKFQEPMVFMHMVWANYAMAWQQSYNAMPMLNNPREAWRLIRTLFKFQVPNGQLSMSVNYHNVGIGGMQPPFQALALDWIFWCCGTDWLTAEDCEKAYPEFLAWLDFWQNKRNAGHGDDKVYIFGPHESGWDDLSLYQKGFPIENPDSWAYMIMLMDDCAVMADKLGKEEEAKQLRARAKKLLNSLITDLWDGDSFVGYMTETGEYVKCKSLDMFQSLILGKDRIPQNIIDKLAKDVMDPEYLTDIGLVTESLKSPLCHFGYNFVLGRVITPCNMLTAAGLYRCGKKEEAREICRRVCQNLYDNGILLGYAPMDTEVNGDPIVNWPNPTASDGWPWTTWAASSALVMLTKIMPED